MGLAPARLGSFLKKFVLAFLLPMLLSCGPVHEALQPAPDDIRSLNRIAVVVPKDGEFIVLFDRATATAAPAILFGLVGAAIASGYNASRDIEKRNALNPHLATFSTRAIFADTFTQTLKASGRKTELSLLDTPPNDEESKTFDAVLTFDIETWGLRLPDQNEERLAPFIELKTTLRRSSDNKALWRMHDTFLGQKRAHISEYKEDVTMLREEMKNTVASAGSRMAMKIVYPRGNAK